MAWGTLTALYQTMVPKEKQGRVFTLAGPTGGALIMAMAPMGLAILGPLADVIGVRSIYLMGAVMAVVVMSALAAAPTVRNMGEEPAEVELAPAGQ